VNRIAQTGSLVLLLAMTLSGPALGQFHPGERPPGLPPGPPPVAIEACHQLTQGNNCEFVGRYGEQVSGTCVVFPERLACLPDNAPPPPPPDDDEAR